MSFQIFGCFYCEFNTTKGRELVFQYPHNYLKTDEFNKISKYMIPREELWNKTVSLKLGNSYLLGYPKYLTHSNYDRTKFQFNFCILIDSDEYESNYYLYELLIQKIGNTFEKLEIESNFCFMKKNTDIILLFLETLYENAKENKQCINFNIGKDNINIHFFFQYFFNDFSKVKSYLIPIWIKKFNIKDKKDINDSIDKIIQNINCINNVKQIEKICNLSSNYVEYILMNLRIQGMISFVDSFRYDNIYRANKEIIKINKDNLFNEFKEFYQLNNQIQIKENGENNVNNNNNELILDISIDQDILYRYYIGLTKAQDVTDFLINYDIKNININILIAFGVYKNIIRKLNPLIPFEKI